MFLFCHNKNFVQKSVLKIISYDHPVEVNDEVECLFTLGDWVLVSYDGHEYPGEVLEVKEDELKVSVVLNDNGLTWHWPRNPDAIFYHLESVIRKRNPPIPNGERNFMFDF